MTPGELVDLIQSGMILVLFTWLGLLSGMKNDD